MASKLLSRKQEARKREEATYGFCFDKGQIEFARGGTACRICHVDRERNHPGHDPQVALERGIVWRRNQAGIALVAQKKEQS